LHHSSHLISSYLNGTEEGRLQARPDPVPFSSDDVKWAIWTCPKTA